VPALSAQKGESPCGSLWLAAGAFCLNAPFAGQSVFPFPGAQYASYTEVLGLPFSPLPPGAGGVVPAMTVEACDHAERDGRRNGNALERDVRIRHAATCRPQPFFHVPVPATARSGCNSRTKGWGTRQHRVKTRAGALRLPAFHILC